jgi:hypothetical protein
MKKILAILAIAFAMPAAHAEEWCTFQPGWSVVTHGTLGDNYFVLAALVGRSDWMWIQISNGTVGKANIATVLAAQLADKSVQIYLDSNTWTCATFPSWAPMGSIRHIKIS